MQPTNDMMDMGEYKVGVYLQDRTLYFFDEIYENTVLEGIKLLQPIVGNKSKQPIQIVLNSRGGSVYDGLAFYDYLTTIKQPLFVTGTGLIASMAVLILLAGKTRYMTKTARLMSHQVSTQVEGKVSDVKIDYDETKELEKICNGIVSERTGQTVKFIENEIKNGDKYMNASEALKKGYIHKVL